MKFFEERVPGLQIVLVRDPSDRADLWVWHYLYHCEHRWSQPWNGFLDFLVLREWKRLAAAAAASQL